MEFRYHLLEPVISNESIYYSDFQQNRLNLELLYSRLMQIIDWNAVCIERGPIVWLSPAADQLQVAFGPW